MTVAAAPTTLSGCCSCQSCWVLSSVLCGCGWYLTCRAFLVCKPHDWRWVAALLQLQSCPLSQEPKTDQDEEHCRKVNEYLNNPPMPGALGASGSGGHELSALGGNGHLPECAGMSVDINDLYS